MKELATSRFTLLIHEAEEGGYWAEVEELPGTVSEGETLPETVLMIAEALSSTLQVVAERERELVPA